MTYAKLSSRIRLLLGVATLSMLAPRAYAFHDPLGCSRTLCPLEASDSSNDECNERKRVQSNRDGKKYHRMSSTSQASKGERNINSIRSLTMTKNSKSRKSDIGIYPSAATRRLDVKKYTDYNSKKTTVKKCKRKRRPKRKRQSKRKGRPRSKRRPKRKRRSKSSSINSAQFTDSKKGKSTISKLSLHTSFPETSALSNKEPSVSPTIIRDQVVEPFDIEAPTFSPSAFLTSWPCKLPTGKHESSLENVSIVPFPIPTQATFVIINTSPAPNHISTTTINSKVPKRNISNIGPMRKSSKCAHNVDSSVSSPRSKSTPSVTPTEQFANPSSAPLQISSSYPSVTRSMVPALSNTPSSKPTRPLTGQPSSPDTTLLPDDRMPTSAPTTESQVQPSQTPSKNYSSLSTNPLGRTESPAPSQAQMPNQNVPTTSPTIVPSGTPSQGPPSSSPIPNTPSQGPPSSSPIPNTPSQGPTSSSPLPNMPSQGPPSSSPLPNMPSQEPPSSSPLPNMPSQGPPSSSPLPNMPSQGPPSSSPLPNMPSQGPPSSSPLPNTPSQGPPLNSPLPNTVLPTSMFTASPSKVQLFVPTTAPSDYVLTPSTLVTSQTPSFYFSSPQTALPSSILSPSESRPPSNVPTLFGPSTSPAPVSIFSALPTPVVAQNPVISPTISSPDPAQRIAGTRAIDDGLGGRGTQSGCEILPNGTANDYTEADVKGVLTAFRYSLSTLLNTELSNVLEALEIAMNKRILDNFVNCTKVRMLRLSKQANTNFNIEPIGVSSLPVDTTDTSNVCDPNDEVSECRTINGGLTVLFDKNAAIDPFVVKTGVLTIMKESIDSGYFNSAHPSITAMKFLGSPEIPPGADNTGGNDVVEVSGSNGNGDDTLGQDNDISLVGALLISASCVSFIILVYFAVKRKLPTNRIFGEMIYAGARKRLYNLEKLKDSDSSINAAVAQSTSVPVKSPTRKDSGATVLEDISGTLITKVDSIDIVDDSAFRELRQSSRSSYNVSDYQGSSQQAPEFEPDPIDIWQTDDWPTSPRHRSVNFVRITEGAEEIEIEATLSVGSGTRSWPLFERDFEVPDTVQF